MMKKMRKIAAALVAVLSMTMMTSTSSYAAEVQTGLIAGVQDAGLEKPVKMDMALSDHEAIDGYGLVRVYCSTYGPGGYTFWIRDYRMGIGTVVPDELPELSGYRHDDLPEGLVFTAEPQEVEVLYYELSTGAPRKSSSGGSGSSSRPTTGEPPKATGSDADHEIGEPPIKHDPTYDELGTFYYGQDPDGTVHEESTITRPQPDGSVEIETTTSVTRPDGSQDTTHRVVVQRPDGSEEVLVDEGMSVLPPIEMRPIPGVPLWVDETEEAEDVGDIESVDIIHIPGVPGTPTDGPSTGSPTTGEPPEKKEDDDGDGEDDADLEVTVGELVDLGTIDPIAGVPMRVDEDGRQYIELGADRHYFDF